MHISDAYQCAPALCLEAVPDRTPTQKVSLGVLRYKWEAYCSTNWRCTAAFPFLQSLEASEAQR